jgi:hypothetical protein
VLGWGFAQAALAPLPLVDRVLERHQPRLAPGCGRGRSETQISCGAGL